MNRRKQRRMSLITIAVLSLLIVTVYFFLFVNFRFLGKRSIHDDAKRYMTRHCLVFHPDSPDGLQMAKKMCRENSDDRVYDYSLIPYGDYYLVSYGNEYRYFCDREYRIPKITQVSAEGEKIIVDYLRYTIKKEHPELYYDAAFLLGLKAENIDFSAVTYELENENIRAHIPEYDIDVLVPVRYLQKALKMDFGFPYELYTKPVYIDPDESHPIICLTFDDGPDFMTEPDSSSSVRIVDILGEYDAAGTFFLIGNNLSDRDVWADYQVYNFLKRSINQGNEYASHTRSHRHLLTDLENAEAIYSEINAPAEYLKDFMDYEMKLYRPVEGVFDERVMEAQPFPAILWDVDSEDWLTLDPEEIIAEVLDQDYETGDVVIFHDVYDTTAEALEKIVPRLIDRGFQLLTVSDMLKYCGIDTAALTYYFSAYDYR